MELNLFKVGVVSTDTSMMADPSVFNPPVYETLDPLVDLTPIGVKDPVLSQTQTILDSPGTTQSTGLTPDVYVESQGNFLDAAGNSITASWKWYNVVTGEIYAQATAPAFHVWGDTDLQNVALMVSAHGYSHVKIMALQLQASNDIVLKKIPYALYLAAVVALIAMAKRKQKQVGAVTIQDVLPFLYIAGGVLAFTFVKQILEALGIWKSKDTKELDAAVTDPNSFWSPYFYLDLTSQGIVSTVPFNRATADQWLSELDDCFHWYGDDEARAKGILKRAPTQMIFSFVSWVFNQNTGEDFIGYLRGESNYLPWKGLSDADINEVNQYISKLKQY